MCSLLTILIGLLAVYIAYQQGQTARNKFRLDYFNRRYPIFEAAMRLVGDIVTQGTITHEERRNFLINTRGVEFFFNDDIVEYCRKLNQEALNIIGGHEKIKATHGDELKKSQELLFQRITWFNEQLDEIPKKFGPYLKIKG